MTYDRLHPFTGRIKERSLLTKPGSTKKTYHIVVDLEDSHLVYKPGDSIAILPSNDPALIDSLLQRLSSDGQEEIVDPRSSHPYSFRVYLEKKANLQKANTPFLRLLHEKTGSAELAEILLPEHKGTCSALLESHSVLDLLNRYPQASFTPQEFVKAMMPLLPRFYSVASSPKIYPDEVHLTVAYVTYLQNGEHRPGVGSRFLCELAEIGETPVPLYLQSAHGFFLPDDLSTDLIMVGPGTGVAPYRAFLQDRIATQATGRHWLFFGERHRATDFYYEAYWLELEKQNRLRISLAFSRDGPDKFYVQHRMWEERRELWNWIENGASFYLCGDAQEMAKDVDAALHNIAMSEANLTEEEARRRIKALRAEKRYLTDVY